MNDDELRERLLATVPDHRSGFWSDLSRTLSTAVPESPDGAVTPSPQGDIVSTSIDRPRDPASYRSPRPPRRNRWVAAVGLAAAAAVVVGAGVVAVRLGPGPQDGVPAVTTSSVATPDASVSPAPQVPTPAASAATNSPSAPSVAVSPSAPHVLGKVLPADGLTQLRRAGVAPLGEVVDGVQWTDRNGDNMLVLERKWSAGAGTLTVVHVAHWETARPTVLRTLTQPSLPGGGPNRSCDTDPVLQYVPDSLQVTDVDNDGVAEASVGWYLYCGGGVGQFEVRLAYLTGGKYFILRGNALVRSDPMNQVAGQRFPKPTYTIDPAPATWPMGLVDRARGDFARYFK